MSFALRLPNNEDLDLLPNATLTLNLENPIFDKQRTDRVWGFPLSVGRTPRNELGLSANRLDGLKLGDKIPVTLYLEGIPYEPGNVRVTKLNNTRIGLRFSNEAIDFAAQAQAIKLRDLDLTVTVAEPFAPEVQLQAQRFTAIGLFKLWIRIDGIDYITDFTDPTTWVASINVDYPGLLTLLEEGGLIHRLVLNDIPGLSDLEINFEPGDTFDDVTNTNNIFLSLVDLNYQSEATRIVSAYQALDSEAEDSAFRLPTIYAPAFYEGKNPEFDGVMNRYDSAQGGYIFQPFHTQVPQATWTDAFLPQPRVASLLEAALEKLGYRLSGSLKIDAELRQLLLFNNHDINVRLTDIGASTPGLFVGTDEDLENAFIVPRPSFNLADHAPDLDAHQLVMLFVESFAHIVRVEADQVTLTPIKELLRAAPEDWTDKINDDPDAAISESKSPVLDYNRQGDENIFPGQLERQQLSTNNDQTPYTLPVFSTFEQDQDQDGVRLRLPIISDEGRNEYLDLGNAPRLRFFFHRGVQPAGTAGRTYPQAGHSLTGYAGQVGAYSMNWLGTGGLYETWWRELIEIIQHGQTLQVQCRLTISDLLEIRQWRNVRKYLRLEDGTVVGVIKSVRIKATTKRLMLATVTFQLEPS